MGNADMSSLGEEMLEEITNVTTGLAAKKEKNTLPVGRHQPHAKREERVKAGVKKQPRGKRNENYKRRVEKHYHSRA